MDVKRNNKTAKAHALNGVGDPVCGAKLRDDAEVKKHWTVRRDGKCTKPQCAAAWSRIG